MARFRVQFKNLNRLKGWKKLRDDREFARTFYQSLKKTCLDARDFTNTPSLPTKATPAPAASSNQASKEQIRPSKKAETCNGVFLEFPVISDETNKRPFFYVVIPSDKFRTTKADPASFRNVFEKPMDEKETAVAFKSMMGDGILVSPKPNAATLQSSCHLLQFIENSPEQAGIDAIQLVASTALKALETDKKVYVSTSGLAVPWLHFRIYPTPKYFVWKEYDN